MKAPIAQFFALPGKAKDYAIGVFIGLYGHQRIKNNSDFASWVCMAQGGFNFSEGSTLKHS
jgi:hypothetical protein